MHLHPDFKDLLAAFAAERVEYLLVGGYAVAFHGRPRFTKDIDLWLGPGDENLARTARAIEVFGVPPSIVESVQHLGRDEIVFFGRPPARVDLIRDLAGVDFEAANARRVDTSWDGVPVRVLGLGDLLAAKKAAAREQDLADVRELEKARDSTSRK
ncbi:MAG: hypothetical protein R3B70_20575 [Polyangiaceae bacterium]